MGRRRAIRELVSACAIRQTSDADHGGTAESSSLLRDQASDAGRNESTSGSWWRSFLLSFRGGVPPVRTQAPEGRAHPAPAPARVGGGVQLVGRLGRASRSPRAPGTATCRSSRARASTQAFAAVLCLVDEEFVKAAPTPLASRDIPVGRAAPVTLGSRRRPVSSGCRLRER